MLMWIKEIFLGFVGLAGGFSVSAAVFAFAITLGVIPRFAGKSHTASHVMAYENAIFFGGVFGTLLSVFFIRVPLGTVLLCVFGLAAGIFTGCLSVALAEILNAFPILFRRAKMKAGQDWVLVAMALGKMVGAFYFYIHHMAK